MNIRRNVAVAFVALMGLGAAPAQGPGLANVMRLKLGHAEKILEAVVTSDWISLETQSRELEQLTRDPRWSVLNAPEYARHSTRFVHAIQDLHRAAAQRDLEQTPKAYVELTLRCVDCHRFLARTRIAQTGDFDRR
jgi:hypothetical protein